MCVANGNDTIMMILWFGLPMIGICIAFACGIIKEQRMKKAGIDIPKGNIGEALTMCVVLTIFGFLGFIAVICFAYEDIKYAQSLKRELKGGK